MTSDRRSAGVLGLVVAVVVLRSSSFVFGLENIDECDFALIAKMIALGKVPFAQIVDIKPPLTYLAFLPAAFGDTVHIWPMHLLAVVWEVATAGVLANAAWHWTGRKDVAWSTAWLFLMATLVDAPSVTTELLMGLPCALSLRAFIVQCGHPSRPRGYFAAGGWVAVGSLFRHQAGILLLGYVLAQWTGRRSRADATRATMQMSAGFALPWAITAGLFVAGGYGQPFFEWVVERNFWYFGKGLPFDFGRALGAVLLCTILTAPLPWILACRATFRRSLDRTHSMLVACVWLTWIPVSLGGRFYEHYFLQFAPPLALLAAPPAAMLLERWPQLKPRMKALVLTAAWVPALGYVGYTFGRGIAGKYPEQDEKSQAIAAWLRANTRADQRMFVWGHFSPIYYLSHRLPGTRYITTSVHMGNFDPAHLPRGFDLTPYRSERDIQRTLQDLEHNQPAIFVDTSPADVHDWSKVPLSYFPEIARYLQAHYRCVAHPGGSDVYFLIQLAR